MKSRLDELLEQIEKEDFNKSPPNDLRNAIVVLVKELRKDFRAHLDGRIGPHDS